MKQNKNKLHITRVYDAPVKLVWEAWTDPKQIAKWWGPRGFTHTTKSKDLKPGGQWIYTMHGPDGVDYPNIATYHEVIEYKKLVYDHGADETHDKLFTVTVLFNEENEKTIMDMTMTVDSEEAATQMKKFIKQAGGNSTWDRLGEHVEGIQKHNDPFIIHRLFEAPQKTVFEMWVNPEHLAHWMGPTGSSMKLIKTDVKNGGSTQYSMSNADASIMYGQINYKKIQPHDSLVYSQNFCDKNGKLCKHPFSPTWPDSMLTTVTFTKEGETFTRVMVKWVVDSSATAIERETFHKAKDGMTVGWTGSLDKLEEYLIHASRS
jgi:uncharacterized protein YndB with AHSA1/START domain